MPADKPLNKRSQLITAGVARSPNRAMLRAVGFGDNDDLGGATTAYFDLRTGVAGDIVQAFVNYQLRLVVLGLLPSAATTSSSFGAFVEEANRGTQIWFVPTAEALEERLRERG